MLRFIADVTVYFVESHSVILVVGNVQISQDFYYISALAFEKMPKC